MSGRPRSGGRGRSVEDSEGRPVLRPAGNTTVAITRSAPAKLGAKQAVYNSPKSPLSKHDAKMSPPHTESPASTGHKVCTATATPPERVIVSAGVGSAPRLGGKTPLQTGAQCRSPLSPAGKSPKYSFPKSSKGSVSLNASCSSEGSTDSSCTRPASAKKSASLQVSAQRKLMLAACGRRQSGRIVPDGIPLSPPAQVKKRCGWITPQSDPVYVAFHDEEWGLPVHDDKRLFELLILSGALAELSWPAILSARDTYRDVFAGFDPVVVAAFSDKKITSLKSTKNIILHEGKLHGILNNAKCTLKIVEEFGSLDKYMWGFVGHKPIVNKYRYPRQVPAKTPKAEVISKDLVKRGFRFVCPTVMYSFMQAAGLTNDHLVHCFRCEECILLSEGQQAGGGNREVQVEDMNEKEIEGIVVKAFEKASITSSHQDFQDEE
eukprot:Gb_31458 [translate_table: standard]